MSTILVIDDTQYLLDSITNLLESSGWEVKGVTNAEDAEQWAALGQYDVILSDWDLGLGQPNGGELVEPLKNLQPDARYIIWSGLEREVPEGVEFFGKDNLRSLMTALNEGTT